MLLNFKKKDEEDKKKDEPKEPAKELPQPKLNVTPAPEKAPEGMVWVPGGEFYMGCTDQRFARQFPDSMYQVLVYVDGFYMDKTEVTNAAYLECVQAKVCKPYREGVAAAMKYGSDREFRHPNQPVVGVSWTDAKTYCEWRGKRLPREAEWERAARGDDGREYPWGNEPPDKNKHGAFAGAKNGTTVDVGSYPDGRGPYGHFDLAGNVWEWTEDMYDPYAYKRPTASEGKPGSCDEILAALNELRRNHQQGYTGTNPIPAECEHVLRGGAFNYRPQGLRASNRVHHPGGFRILVAGFRCAKDM